MGDLIDRLEDWAETLEEAVGSTSNPFYTDIFSTLGSNLLTLLVWVLMVMILMTSALDLMYICFPSYRLLLSTAKNKVMAAFGKESHGTGGVRLAHTTRDTAARKADTDGVAHGLVYYLKHRVYFYIFFGFFVTIFFSGNGLMKLIMLLGQTVRNMYMSTLVH